MRVSGDIKRQSILNAKRESLRTMLKARACNAVGIVVHGRKYKIDDFTKKDPGVEHIRSIKGSSSDCIQKVVDAVLVEGEKTGRTKEIINIFFDKPGDHEGCPLFDKGKEMAALINSIASGHLKFRMTSTLVNVYIQSMSENTVEKVMNTFDKVNCVCDESGLQFLKYINTLVKKQEESKKAAGFCDAINSTALNICLKQFSGNEEQPALASEFMRRMCELCIIIPEEKVARRVSLSMFEIYGSMLEKNKLDTKSIDFILESAKKTAKESKNAEYVCAAVEGAKTIYVTGHKSELENYFGIVQVMQTHFEDIDEAAVGLVQIAQEIGKGVKAEELGRRYMTLKGGNIRPGQSEDMIDGEFEIEVLTGNAEDSESDYPEIEEDEEDITVSKKEKLEIQFRDMLGEGFGDVFEEKAIFVNRDEEFDFCNRYIMIFERIMETAGELEVHERERYVGLAENIFREMDNNMKFAPVAYSVLGELVRDYPPERVEFFVKNVCKAKDDKLLMYLCNEIRKDGESAPE